VPSGDNNEVVVVESVVSFAVEVHSRSSVERPGRREGASRARTSIGGREGSAIKSRTT